MSVLLVGDDEVTDADAVGIALTSAQMLELRRTGRVEFTEAGTPNSPTVVIGHEDALDSLVEEVSD